MDHPLKSKETISRFEKLLAALVASETDFAVVGGLAIIFNGYPRLTLDADILVSDAPKNLHKLLRCLEQWGEGFARELKPEDFVFQEGAVRVTEGSIWTFSRGCAANRSTIFVRNCAAWKRAASAFRIYRPAI